MRTTLPWRLRIFEKFPTRPQMVQLRKVNSEFPMPKVRDSFTRQFFDSEMSDAYFGGGIAYVGGLCGKFLFFKIFYSDTNIFCFEILNSLFHRKMIIFINNFIWIYAKACEGAFFKWKMNNNR